MSNCHILLPGLLRKEKNRAFSLPDAITLLCTRGRHESWSNIPDTESFLLAEFGIPNQTGIGAITGLADGLDTEQDYWIRIDPVHLHLNRDQLILLDTKTFELQQDEADKLAHTINQHFKNEEFHILTPCPNRWYMRFNAEQNLAFHPKNQVVGQSINPYLPTGEKGMEWRVLINEIQMLLFEHPVNEARETRGELTINSLWPWAQGRLPVIAKRPWERILSQNPLAAGLAALGGLEHMILPPTADRWIDNIQSGDLVILEDLLAFEQFDDESAWNQAITNLEVNWFAPLLAALKSNRIDKLIFHPMSNSRVFHIETRRSDLWKLWRRNLPG